MLGQLTSLTGGGGLSSSSSSSANGDNAFENDFNYKNGSESGGNNQLMIVGAVAVLVLLVLKGKK